MINDEELEKIAYELKNGKYKKLSKEKYAESDLLKIANKMMDNVTLNIKQLINIILNNNINENCDWNIGSILQHFDYNDIISILDIVPLNKRGYLYDSIGLCWVLGECPYKNDKVISFLYEVIDNARNPESWWKAAFSLEKITGKNAINNLKRSLKNYSLISLEESLNDLTNKKNIISVLLHSNSSAIREKIYPFLRKRFDICDDTKEMINIIWLLGRLRLYDESMLEKSLKLLTTSDSYELKYYILQAMIDDPKNVYIDYFRKFLCFDDILIKKMAIIGLGEVGTNLDVETLKMLLQDECNPSIIAEITKAIYKIKNKYFTVQNNYIQKYMVNENGLIGDDSDKWYADAAIYNLFSEAEDPENICFDIIFNKILSSNIKIRNPIDLATGTGRAAKYILNNISYEGKLFAVDYSKKMLEYFDRTINRQKYYVKEIELVHSRIQDFTIPNAEKSSFVISSFGFPSKISDFERCQLELMSVYNMLSDDGVFITLGWDETFNDELNTMWYRYVPDKIKAANFEEWRRKREGSIISPRNCELVWLKRNIQVPLLFDTLEETINVMGHLFGRDAALEILKTKRTMWWMSMGITWNDKQSIAKILKK